MDAASGLTTHSPISVVPVIDPSVRGLCTKPYEGHPRGCPNFKHKEGCPPRVPLFFNYFDRDKSVWAIFRVFDLEVHVQRMKRTHPSWSDRQARCCLYWQGGVLKLLRKQVNSLLDENWSLEVTYCPEAMGVDVTATMKQVGIELEWPPRRLVMKIAMIGTPLENTSESS
jgi:predicted metal-binding protein